MCKCENMEMVINNICGKMERIADSHLHINTFTH